MHNKIASQRLPPFGALFRCTYRSISAKFLSMTRGVEGVTHAVSSPGYSPESSRLLPPRGPRGATLERGRGGRVPS